MPARELRVLKGASPWLPQRVRSPRLDLVVRTVNTQGGESHYASRLLAIARNISREWTTAGLIAMQEVKQTDDCPVPPERDHGAPCFARILEQEYRRPIGWGFYDSLGVLVGQPWEIVGAVEHWKLGKDSWSKLGKRATRYLIEVRVIHQVNRRMVRFYTAHLSHDRRDHPHEQEDQRNHQIDKLRSIVTDPRRANPGELPPIIAGDFNFTIDGEVPEPSSFDRMNADFEVVHSTGKDHIWVGRATSFPQTEGSFAPFGGRVTDLTGLSDHASPSVGFTIK